MNPTNKIENVLRLTPAKKGALKKIGIETLRDLLYYFPSRYIEFSGLKNIDELVVGENASVAGEIERIEAEKTWKKKLRLAQAVIKDETGRTKAVWFNQPYLANILKPGAKIMISGKVSQKRQRAGLVLGRPELSGPAERKKELYFANPQWKLIINNQETITNKIKDTKYKIQDTSLLPVYSETYGVSSEWLRWQIKKTLDQIKELPEIIPEEILKKYHLPGVKRALAAVHFPKIPAEAEAAKKRFSFEEIFLIQTGRQIAKKENRERRGVKIEPDEKLTEEFIESLPYFLTAGQKRAIGQILEDFKKPHPMARLLEGDVGSGKTVVAAAAALNALNCGYQVAFMAPTEILARQHFEEFIKRLERFRVSVGLLTSSESKKFPSKISFKKSADVSKAQLLKSIFSGDLKIIIGTHSLIQNKVKFKKLGLVVIDEQHRFGTEQRSRLAKGKDEVEKKEPSFKILKPSQIGLSKASPHLLSMTATPIPRTLALTLYGDLDLSVLDEMPPGRKKIITKIVSPREREATYDFIRSEIKNGRQAFVICPRIETKKMDEKTQNTKFAPSANSGTSSVGSQTIGFRPKFQTRLGLYEMKAVKEEYKKLKDQIFPEFEIAMLHGRMKPKEKEETMKKFKDGKTKILVSTSVVEVGIDVSNATIMMIEGGERFGLATLHQFRGRVGRGEYQSYCFVFAEKVSGKSMERLRALQDSKSGFELAEYDLSLRGPGELAGRSQWGISDVGMEALKNIKMVEAARNEAESLVEKDLELKNYPLLKKRVEEIGQKIHFE